MAQRIPPLQWTSASGTNPDLPREKVKKPIRISFVIQILLVIKEESKLDTKREGMKSPGLAPEPATDG